MVPTAKSPSRIAAAPRTFSHRGELLSGERWYVVRALPKREHGAEAQLAGQGFRVFLPNLVNVTLTSDALARSVRLRISAAALRSVEHRGGLDAFLAKSHDEELSQNVRDLKREIAKKQTAAATA